MQRSPVQPADDHLVTVARFRTAGEAQLARSFLATQGIQALVMEQDALRLDPFRPPPSSPIRLQVRQEDLAASRELLGEAAEPGS